MHVQALALGRDHQVHQKRPQTNPRVSPEGPKCDPRGMPKSPGGCEQRRCSRKGREQGGLLTAGVANESPPVGHPNNDFRCFRWVCLYEQKS